jgi:fructose-bisphosphate aldolase class I
VLEATLLKPNMVLPGTASPRQTSNEDIAQATVAAFRRAVPAAVPGIVCLSGGQSDEEATARLDALNRCGRQPWELSFSFGRALQAPVLRAWAGDEDNRGSAQAALLRRAKLNGAARQARTPRDGAGVRSAGLTGQGCGTKCPRPRAGRPFTPDGEAGSLAVAC